MAASASLPDSRRPRVISSRLGAGGGFSTTAISSLRQVSKRTARPASTGTCAAPGSVTAPAAVLNGQGRTWHEAKSRSAIIMQRRGNGGHMGKRNRGGGGNRRRSDSPEFEDWRTNR